MERNVLEEVERLGDDKLVNNVAAAEDEDDEVITERVGGGL